MKSISNFERVLSIPENENDLENEIFILKRKEDGQFFVCFQIKEDTDEFFLYSSEYELLKSFNDNEISLGETINENSLFFELKLNENGVTPFINELDMDMIEYDFNESDITPIKYDKIKNDNLLINRLDNHIENFY